MSEAVLQHNWHAKVLRLRQEVIADQLDEVPMSMIDCAAHMLLYFDQPRTIQRIGLRHLIEKFGVNRADVGFGSSRDRVFTVSAAERRPDCVLPDLTGVTLSNYDLGIQTSWNTSGVLCFDVSKMRNLDSFRSVLRNMGTRSKLTRRLEYKEDVFGLLCVDQTEDYRDWSEADRSYLNLFVIRVMSPIFAESLKAQPQKLPVTVAELEVLRLAAEGLSYKEIAAKLGKSPNTIDNQLSQLRVKFGARNRVELLRACESVLPM